MPRKRLRVRFRTVPVLADKTLSEAESGRLLFVAEQDIYAVGFIMVVLRIIRVSGPFLKSLRRFVNR